MVFFTSREFYKFISLFPPQFLVSIKKIYETVKTVFDHISRHLEVCQKYSAKHYIFNSLHGAWKNRQIWSFVFEMTDLN